MFFSYSYLYHQIFFFFYILTTASSLFVEMADPTGPPPHSFTGILKDIEHQNPPRDSDDVSQSHEDHHALSEKASSHRRSKPASIDIDKTQPQDFDGELSTNNELPSTNVQKMIEDYIVLDRHGKSRTFKSLYMGNNKARRVLVIFIRHFFCGVCLFFFLLLL